jgi:hypothetical protein
MTIPVVIAVAPHVVRARARRSNLDDPHGRSNLDVHARGGFGSARVESRQQNHRRQ